MQTTCVTNQMNLVLLNAMNGSLMSTRKSIEIRALLLISFFEFYHSYHHQNIQFNDINDKALILHQVLLELYLTMFLIRNVKSIENFVALSNINIRMSLDSYVLSLFAYVQVYFIFFFG